MIEGESDEDDSDWDPDDDDNTIKKPPTRHESDWDDKDYTPQPTPQSTPQSTPQPTPEIETKIVVVPKTYLQMYNDLQKIGMIQNSGKIWQNQFAKKIVDQYQLDVPDLAVSFEEYVRQEKTKTVPLGTVYEATGPPLPKKSKQSTSNKYRFKYHMVKRVLRSLH
jgi:hypothetical protein